MVNILKLLIKSIDIMSYLWHKISHVLAIKIFNFFFKKFIKRRLLWHRYCFENSCQSLHFYEKFLSIIPKKIPQSLKQCHTDFTRKRKLPFPKLITFILSIVVNGKSQGVDTKAGIFFTVARRCNLWNDASPIHRSALTKARKKVSWSIFQDILNHAVKLAYEIWPKKPEYLWHAMSIYAIDGSVYTLPATPKLREEFDPDSGLGNSGKGHYPQCLVSTVYDVFRRLPIDRSICKKYGSEREEAKTLIPSIPSGGVILFDRGYPGYEFIKEIINTYLGYFIFRCSATSSFPAVISFLSSGKKESVIWIKPTQSYRRDKGTKLWREAKPIKLRVIKLVAPDGTVSVLLTNLFEARNFIQKDIIDLYFRRWEIETHYRNEKIVLEVEKFHGKTPNSIRQELFAIMIMSVISRTIMVLSVSESQQQMKGEPQFKNAMMTLAHDAAVLTPSDPEKAIKIFEEIIKQIARVKYYPPKKKRISQPRLTKRKINKWCIARQIKLLTA